MAEESLKHISVLKEEILNQLLTDDVKTVLDGTLGLGGHAEVILEKYSGINKYIGFDLDKQHLLFAKKRLEKWEDKVAFYNTNFSNIASVIEKESSERPLVILLDLGLCSNQLDDEEKGFSFQKDGPLNMAFGSEVGKTAEEVVNNYEVRELTRVFREYGEDPSARRIAFRIEERRSQKEFKTTGELREVIEHSVHPKDRNKSLMRIFQAIRMEVNDELSVLKKVLEGSIEIMKTGDRIGVISYHSLEDRIVKKIFIQASKPITEATQFSLHTEVEPAKIKKLNKKPILPSEEELLENPRSRSAKLRIIEKI